MEIVFSILGENENLLKTGLTTVEKLIPNDPSSSLGPCLKSHQLKMYLGWEMEKRASKVVFGFYRMEALEHCRNSPGWGGGEWSGGPYCKKMGYRRGNAKQGWHKKELAELRKAAASNSSSDQEIQVYGEWWQFWKEHWPSLGDIHNWLLSYWYLGMVLG